MILAAFAAAFSGCQKPSESAEETGSKEEMTSLETEADPEPESESETETETEAETETETKAPEEVDLLSLSDTYQPNGLTFSMFEVGSGDLFYRCPSIGGLKDETVKSRVNVSLFQHVQAEVEALSLQYPEGIRTLSTTSVLYASFSNVLSVKTSLVVEEANPSSDAADRPLVVEFFDSFELITGRPITFRDLFSEDVTVEDLFGEAKNALEHAKLKSARTMEPVEGHVLSEYADLSEEADRLLVLWDENALHSFRFDEKEAALIFETGSVVYELPVSYRDHLKETAVYSRYLTEDSLYETEVSERFPVLFKRFPCYYAYSEDSEKAFMDAVLYAPNDPDERLNVLLTDAVSRLESRIREISSDPEARVVYNAELTLYEMKNGYINGKPTPFYITVKEFFWSTGSEEEYRAFREVSVEYLQNMSEEEAALQKTLFLSDAQENVQCRFVTWYYDEVGGFVEESLLETP